MKRPISTRSPARCRPAISVVQTAGADFRGEGVEDLVVLASGPSRFTPLQPYVVFGGANGPERAVPLGSFVEGGFYGSVGATVRADDVNADGKPEITFSAFVGAHSALLWVLQWNGSTFVPLFAEGSNAPVVDLADLDGDGVAEILLGQSGDWELRLEPADDVLLPMGGRRVPVGLDGHHVASGRHGRREPSGRHAKCRPAGRRRAPGRARSPSTNAFRGCLTQTRAAYQSYAQFRQQVAHDARLSTRPIYLAALYVRRGRPASRPGRRRVRPEPGLGRPRARRPPRHARRRPRRTGAQLPVRRRSGRRAGPATEPARMRASKRPRHARRPPANTRQHWISTSTLTRRRAVPSVSRADLTPSVIGVPSPPAP